MTTKLLIDRFLSWPLPESLCSDPCASMPGYPHRTGTNLMTAEQAKAMLDYVLAAPRQPEEVGELAERMKDAERNEKHWNVQQTRYWCNQYKLLARAALAKLDGKA